MGTGLVKPFIILSLPRSRTAWLSHFLSYNQQFCAHDISLDSKSVGDLWARLGYFRGTVETGAAFAWPLFVGKAKVFVVRRPVAEVDASFRLMGLEVPLDELERRAADLDTASEVVGVRTIQHRALADENVCAWLFEQCLGLPFDRGWWAALAGVNIQLDMAKRFEKIRANHPQIERLKTEARNQVAQTHVAV